MRSECMYSISQNNFLFFNSSIFDGFSRANNFFYKQEHGFAKIDVIHYLFKITPLLLLEGLQSNTSSKISTTSCFLSARVAVSPFLI